MNQTFNYSVLQYRHSQALGEALNIGLIFSFPDEKKFHFIAGNTQRVKCVYPNFDSTIFTKITKNIKIKVEATNRYNNSLFGENFPTFKDYINKEILPEDATSLQFTDAFTAVNDLGNTNEIIDEFSKLLLPDSNNKPSEKKRNEAYIIRKYQDDLFKKVSRSKYDNLIRKENLEVKTKKAAIDFDLGWKNESLLHLVKAISFDLESEDAIREKAVKFWGNLTLLKNYAIERDYSFDLLIAGPEQPELQEPYQNALETLNEADSPKKIFTEDKIDEYANVTAINLNKERA